MGSNSTAGAEAAGMVPRGGMWERQALYGGKRLAQEFGSGEAFILWAIKAGGEVPVTEGGESRMVDKTVLTVSRLETPEDRFEVGTLSSAIADMVAQAQPGDFPVECIWEEVSTKRGLSPATVLTAVRPWLDPAND